MAGPVRLSEADFQQRVIDYAQLNGWLVYHTYDSRRSREGWPDLTLIRPPELIFSELKRDGENPTPQQRVLLGALEACHQEAHVWRPADWDEIVLRLRRRR